MMKYTRIALSLVIYLTILDTTRPESTLKQIHILFRHGERSPTETYKNDPYINMSWSGGWGQLTNRGKFQMYTLGQKMRDWYPDFIPVYYTPQEVFMRSSYADRCLMSAQLVLAGLFPPKDDQVWNKDLAWQPIPVHYVPRAQDKTLAMKANCNEFNKALAEVYESKPLQTINEENAELYEYLSKHTGESIKGINIVETLSNTLEIEKLHNLTLPEWTFNVSLEHLKKLGGRHLAVFTETDYMKKIRGGPFLKNLLDTMKNSTSQVYLYSAHDITLVNILNTLGYKPFLKPGFGASLIFELHNTSEIKIIYRDDLNSNMETNVSEYCGASCLLGQFSDNIQKFLPINWEKECNN